MENSIELLQEWDVPTHSYLKAVQELARKNYTQQVYELKVQQLLQLPFPPSASNVKEARILFLYTVQELIKWYYNILQFETMEDFYNHVQRRVENFKEVAPWAITIYEQASDINVINDTPRKQTRRRLGESKKVLSERMFLKMKDTATKADIMKRFMDELDMSTAGARTYFLMHKKTHGFTGADK